MDQVYYSGSLVCKGCGGGISVSSGQTIVLPPVTMTFWGVDGDLEVVPSDEAWCGDCVDSWNARLTD